MLHVRRSYLVFGAFFGAWLGFVYVFVSQGVNWLALPGIPLAAPAGSLAAFLSQYILSGILLGLISTIPDNRLAGAVLGGFFAALMSSIIATSDAWYLGTLGSTLITVLLTFLPLVVMMTPLAYIIRLGVDSQVPDTSRPYLQARRYLIPLLVTGLVVVLASFSLYSPEIRRAFLGTNQLVQEGLSAKANDAMPEPLKEIAGFPGQAVGNYRLQWSDRVETFFGPRPAGAELSQFLIITRFENGFAFACLYSGNRSVPTCTNYR